MVPIFIFLLEEKKLWDFETSFRAVKREQKELGLRIFVWKDWVKQFSTIFCGAKHIFLTIFSGSLQLLKTFL